MSDDAWLENDLGGLECGCAVRIVWGIATALRCVSFVDVFVGVYGSLDER